MKRLRNKGFSLVELIIVIAIMGILTAVLSPKLFAYIEDSRAEGDNSAMSEITNAVKVAMADENVYDEILYYAMRGNASCYTAPNYPANDYAKETLGYDFLGPDYEFKNSMQYEYYKYNDTSRDIEKTRLAFDGLMYGVTITFEPYDENGDQTVYLSSAKVNIIGSGLSTVTKNNNDIGRLQMNSTTDGIRYCTLSSMQKPGSANTYLYEYLKSAVGSEVKLKSQVYENSSYTVFISLGSVTKNDISNNNAVEVYGQWNGTKLKN